MSEYTVVWKAFFPADSPEEAAQKAYEYQQKRNHPANFFTVVDEEGNETGVEVEDLKYEIKNK